MGGTLFLLFSTPIQTCGQPKKNAMPVPQPSKAGTLRAYKVANEVLGIAIMMMYLLMLCNEEYVMMINLR